MIGEDVVAGRVRVEVVGDYRPLRRDMKAAAAEAREAGRETGAAFAQSSAGIREADESAKGLLQTMAGMALLLVSRVTSAWRGFLGIVARGTSIFVDFTGLGLLHAARGLRVLAESTRDANGELTAAGRVAETAAGGLETLARVAMTVSGIITGVQLAVAALAAKMVVDLVRAAHSAEAEFKPAWNRVLTLFQGSGVDVTALRQLRGEVSDLAGVLGVDGVQSADAFYQVLSAMPHLVRDTAGAMEVLHVALDVGATGFADTGTAADAVTGILNAFRLEATQARDVADALFAAQDQGVLTFGEVASSIGSVSNLTASLNGDYRDLLGIVATLTPQNVTVAESFTQIRAVIAAVLKPTTDAQLAARELGVDFSATALKAQGLNNFLLEMIRVTEGNPEIIARFFGAQEAQALLVALSQRTDELRQKTDIIGNSAGSTRAKVDQMNDSWERQSEILDQRIKSGLREIGTGMENTGAKGLRFISTMLAGMDEFARRIRNAQLATNALGRDFNHWITGNGPRQSVLRPGPGDGTITPGLMSLPGGAPTPFTPYLTTPNVGPGPRVGAEIPKWRRPTPEPTTLEYAQEKIDERARLLQAQAVLDLSRTGNMEAYEAATKSARQEVNRLVLAEIERFQAAGKTEEAVAALAALYQVDTSAQQKARQDRQTAERKAAADLKSDMDELRQARERHATAAEREIAQLREWADVAQRRGEAGLAEQLRAEARELEIYGTTAGQWADQLEAAFSGAVGRKGLFDGARLANPFEGALRAVQPDLDALVLSYETAMGQIEQRKAAGIITPEKAEEEGRAAADAFNRGLLSILEHLEANHLLPPQELNKLRGMFKDVKVPDSSDNIRAQAREAGSLARAFLGVADAAGGIDSELRGSLESAIQLAEVLGSIAGGAKLDFASFASGVGAVAGIVSGIMAAGERERQARQELIAQISRNTRALEAFREREIRDMSEAERTRLLGAADDFERRYGEQIRAAELVGMREGRFRDMTPEMVEFLTRLEEITGSEFFNDKTGFLNFEEYRKALEGFRESDLGGFGSDLAGELDRLEFVFRTAGEAIGDAAAQMAMFIERVREFSPEFAAELEAVLQAGGPEAARAWLQQLSVAYAQGGVQGVRDVFGPDVSAEEIERILAAAGDRLAEIERGAGEAGEGGESRSYHAVRTISERTGHAIYSVLTTIAYLVRRIAERTTGEAMAPVYSPEQVAADFSLSGAARVDVQELVAASLVAPGLADVLAAAVDRVATAAVALPPAGVAVGGAGPTATHLHFAEGAVQAPIHLPPMPGASPREIAEQVEGVLTGPEFMDRFARGIDIKLAAERERNRRLNGHR